jgi:cysteine desulfurase
VASSVNADDKYRVVFTGSGTEANNLALAGSLQARIESPFYHGADIPHVITSNLEHPAVLLVIKNLTDYGLIETTYLNDAIIKPSAVKNAIQKNTALVSLMWAHNEVGTVTDIPEVAYAVKSTNPSIMFHTDAAQAVGKVDVDLEDSYVDMMTIVGHKIGAPKGIAALIARKNI